MSLLRKVKEVGFSIIPILLFVSLLHFFAFPLEEGLLPTFLIGGVLVIVGLSLFLLGTEIGLLPIGERIGSAATRTMNLPFLLGTGFIIGIVIIIAEPNISILIEQVSVVNPSSSPLLLVSLIALGVGFYLMLGIMRVVLRLSLKWIYTVSYLLIFVIAYASSPQMLGIAFDSGGAATGPLAVPFIMALGIGIARVQKKQNESDNFGYVSLALIGPTVALLILGLFGGQGTQAASSVVSVPISGAFITLIGESSKQVAKALSPLLVLFMLYQIFLVKMPIRQLIRMFVGIIYIFVGLTLFFMGANGAFMPVGYHLGHTIGSLHPHMLLLVGLAIGALTVMSEPSVWVLIDQVQTITQGHIRRPVMLVALAIGVGLSLVFAMLRVLYALPLWYFVLPVYTIAVIFSFFMPDLFVGLSFDSGSVSSGPMASTFILSFAIGASVAVGGNPITDAFGIIIFVSMTPVVIVQLLGLLYKRKQAKLAQKKGGTA